MVFAGVGSMLLAQGGGVIAVPFSMASLVFSLWSLWITIQMAFFPGDPGSNDFGHRDPLSFVGGSDESDVDAFPGMARATSSPERVPRMATPSATTHVPVASRAVERREGERRQGFGARNDGTNRRAPQGFGRRAPA